MSRPVNFGNDMKSSSKIALLATCLMLTAGAGAANAADLPVYSVPAALDFSVDLAVQTADRWTGFYVGGHLGGGFVNRPAGDDRDIIGGIQAGYNLQLDQFVIGAELEGAMSNRLQYKLGAGGILEQTFNGTAKARAGIAMDNVLLYGTLGVNVARLEGKGAVTSGDRWQAGLAFGGGVEVAFNEHLSGKLEYTQTRFNGVESRIGGVARKDDLVNHAVKAGVNFHF